VSAAPTLGEARPMLRIGKAAGLLDTPVSTLRRWVSAGQIDGARKVGRCWVVPISWVAEPVLIAPATEVAA
jgi:Helix-turn-helix domain